MLARAAGRQREMQWLAVGASRWNIVRQLLVENLVLSAAGRVAGLVFALGRRDVERVRPADTVSVHFDASVNVEGVLFAMGLTVITALVSGVMPALRASRPEVGVTLKDRIADRHRIRGQLRQMLVVAQVGLSVVLRVRVALRAQPHARRIDGSRLLRCARDCWRRWTCAGHLAARVGGHRVERRQYRPAHRPHAVQPAGAGGVGAVSWRQQRNGYHD
jgi:hypothetical protein